MDIPGQDGRMGFTINDLFTRRVSEHRARDLGLAGESLDERISQLEHEYAELMLADAPQAVRLAKIVSELGQLWNTKEKEQPPPVKATLETPAFDSDESATAENMELNFAESEGIPGPPSPSPELAAELGRTNIEAEVGPANEDLVHLQQEVGEVVREGKEKMSRASSREKVQEVFLEGLRRLRHLMDE